MDYKMFQISFSSMRHIYSNPIGVTFKVFWSLEFICIHLDIQEYNKCMVFMSMTYTS